MMQHGTRAAAPGLRARAVALIALSALLVLLCAPARALAATPTITSLYTTTLAATNAWTADSQRVPPKVSFFALGTTAVSAVFSYSGAQAYSGSQFQLEITAPTGAIVAKSPFHLFVKASGMYGLVAFHGPSGHPDGQPYPAGSYQATILVDGKHAASVSFTVGTAHAAPNPTRVVNSLPEPSATATAVGATPTPRATATAQPPSSPTPVPTVADRIVPGQGLVAFYITSLAAAHIWQQDHTAIPPHVLSFATGTTSVAGYFAYANPALLDGRT